MVTKQALFKGFDISGIAGKINRDIATTFAL
jgi:hypothetical protein